MRIRSGLSLVLPALIFAGCASTQSLDAQTAARQQLEERVTKLEAGQAAQIAKLDRLAPSSSELKSQLDGLRGQVAAQQPTLSTLLGKVDSQAAALAAVSGKVDNQATALAALSRKVGDQATAVNSVAGRVERQDTTLTTVGNKVDNLATALASVSGSVESQANALSTLTSKVDDQTTAMNSVAGSVESQAAALTSMAGKVDTQATAVENATETANDAVKIARDSRTVSGKIVDSLLLTDDMVLYNYEQPELTAKGRAALDELIKHAVPQLPNIFIEILGYSDDISLGSQSRRIALERGESVRRYLFEVGGIPLHRMSVISYGDLKPLASNDSLEGRSRNRRVAVRVLK